MAVRRKFSHRLTMTVLAWLVGLLIFFPILWTVLTSFKSELDAFAIPPKFLFFHWTFGELRRGAGALQLHRRGDEFDPAVDRRQPGRTGDRRSRGVVDGVRADRSPSTAAKPA